MKRSNTTNTMKQNVISPPLLIFSTNFISDLDSQIVKLVQEEDELVGDVCEAEESLLTIIAQITQLLETRSTPVDMRPPPQPVLVTNSDLLLPSPQDIPV